MSHFLIVMPTPSGNDWSRGLFASGLQLEQHLRGHEPSATLANGQVYAAAFPRRKAVGAVLVTDDASGNWLAIMGTWFHADGLGPGQELLLLRKFAVEGIDRTLQGLQGFFALAHGVQRTGTVTVATDIIGSCHCFIRRWPGAIAIAGSSMLLAAMGDSTLDPVACQEFLSLGVIYEDRTIHREVRKLGPAACITYREGQMTAERRYWYVAGLEPNSLDGKAAISALQTTLRQAAAQISAAFHRPVCDLTGGYDSRALVAGLRSGGLQFSTVVSGGRDSPDVVVSKAIAAVAGLPHRHVESAPVTGFADLAHALEVTDGEYDCVEYARVYRIHAGLAERGDISLNGSFGEVGRGFWWEVLFPHAGQSTRLDAAKLARLRYAAERFDPGLFPRAGRLDFVDHLSTVIDRVNEGLGALPNTMQMDNIYLNMRMQHWQGRIASSTNGIWPCLSPFMLRPVLEAMLRTRYGLRRRSLLIRQFLAETDPLLADYPLEHGYPPAPMSWRNAHRFWPVASLYAGKVLNRARRYAGLSRPSAAAPGDDPVLLWHDTAIAESMNKSSLHCDAVLDANAARQFVRRASVGGQPYLAQAHRLMTLECALDRLTTARRQLQQQRGNA